MVHEHVELLETAAVEQFREPFPCRQLAFGVLRVNALLPSSQRGGCASVDESSDFFFLYAHIIKCLPGGKDTEKNFYFC